MKSCFLLFLALAQFIQFTYSSPLGPPGAEDPGAPYAVPQHTTQGFFKRHLKNLYSYFFNKEESVHQDGHTKVYVMGKHMYYTYTHEYTPDNGEHPFDRANRANVGGGHDDMLKYLKDDELIKKRNEELEYHKQNKRKLEEESIRQMKEGWTPGTDPVPPELQVKSSEYKPEQNNVETSKEGGIMKTILGKIGSGIFKMAIPTILKRSRRSENEDTSPPNGIKDKLKSFLKPVVVKFMGKPHSKISDNVKEEIKGVASKIPGVIGTAAIHVKDAIGTVIGTVAEKLVDGVKSAVVVVGTNVIPTNVQNMPWRQYKDKITDKLLYYARKSDILNEFIPNPDDPKNSYNRWIQMKEHWGHIKKKE